MLKKTILSLILTSLMVSSSGYAKGWFSNPPKPLYIRMLRVIVQTSKQSLKWSAKKWKHFAKKNPTIAHSIILVSVLGLGREKFSDGLKWVWNGTAGKILGKSESEEVKRLMKAIKPKLIPKVKLKDLLGNAKNSNIVKTIIRQNKYPKTYGKNRIQNLLLEGPPGSGKSHLVRAIVNELKTAGKNVTFFDIKGEDDVSNPYVSMTEKTIGALFESVRAAGRPSMLKRFANWVRRKETENNNVAVLFLDEIDSLAGKRQSGSKNHEKAVLSALLREIETGNPDNQDCNILIVGCTNRLDLLDKAVTRPGRFTPKTLPNPETAKERKEFLEGFTKQQEVTESKKFTQEAKNYLFNELSKNRYTKYFSVANLKEILDKSCQLQSNNMTEQVENELGDDVAPTQIDRISEERCKKTPISVSTIVEAYKQVFINEFKTNAKLNNKEIARIIEQEKQNQDEQIDCAVKKVFEKEKICKNIFDFLREDSPKKKSSKKKKIEEEEEEEEINQNIDIREEVIHIEQQPRKKKVSKKNELKKLFSKFEQKLKTKNRKRSNSLSKFSRLKYLSNIADNKKLLGLNFNN